MNLLDLPQAPNETKVCNVNQFSILPVKHVADTVIIQKCFAKASTSIMTIATCFNGLVKRTDLFVY